MSSGSPDLYRFIDIEIPYSSNKNKVIRHLKVYSHLGYEKEAKEAGSGLILHRPDFSIEQFLKNTPYKNKDHLSFIADALRKAGLPE
jgi:hypothetical protein